MVAQPPYPYAQAPAKPESCPGIDLGPGEGMVSEPETPNTVAHCSGCNAHVELVEALRDLRESCTVVYATGRIAAEPFLRAGNVLAGVDKCSPAKPEPLPYSREPVNYSKEPVTHAHEELAEALDRLGEFTADGSLLEQALSGAANALPELFTMCSKLGFREGATVCDEINAGVITARKELAHVRSLLSALAKVSK